jgi:hypothetical protein
VDNQQDAPPPSATVPLWPTTGDQGFVAASCPVDPNNPAQRVLAPGCAVTPPLSQTDLDQIDADGDTTVSFLGPTPSAISDTSWTAFGSLTLNKRWTPEIVSSASYSRSFDTASGVAGSAISDYVSLLTTWQITQLWSLAVRGDFTRRESTSPLRQDLLVVEDQLLGGGPTVIAQAVGLSSTVLQDSLDTNRWGVSTRLARRINDNLVVSTRYSFNRQSSRSGTVGRFSDFDDHIVTLAVEYDFDRWRLW